MGGYKTKTKDLGPKNEVPPPPPHLQNCLGITTKWLKHVSCPKQKQGTKRFTTGFAVVNEFYQGLRFVHNPTKSTKQRPLQNWLEITSKN